MEHISTIERICDFCLSLAQGEDVQKEGIYWICQRCKEKAGERTEPTSKVESPNHQSGSERDGLDGMNQAGLNLPCPGNHEDDEHPCDECIENQIMRSI